MGELGLHGITVEEEYGGSGLGTSSTCAVEELSRASAAFVSGASTVNQISRNAGEQKKRLPKLLSVSMSAASL